MKYVRADFLWRWCHLGHLVLFLFPSNDAQMKDQDLSSSAAPRRCIPKARRPW